MTEITPEWLRERLGDDRGQKVALADAIGVSPDKISKMISGVRKPQAQEVPKILAFFSAGHDWNDLTGVLDQLSVSDQQRVAQFAESLLRTANHGQTE